MKLIRDLRIDDMDDLVAGSAQPAYRTDQILRWLYVESVRSWEQMSNLPSAWRDELCARYRLSGLTTSTKRVSKDGTRKFLFELHDGKLVEAVSIPMDTHRTFCISTQVGCAMGCTFCKTAEGGLERNLTPGEIIEQVQLLAEDTRQNTSETTPAREFNIVLMGMGEPLANFENVATAIRTLCDPRGAGISSRRITLSTSGLGAGLRKMIDSDLNIGLTLSLNNTRDKDRKRIMPIPGRTPIAEILDLAGRYAASRKRPVTIAYVMIAGVNDEPGEAKRLANLIGRYDMKVNLIPMNAIGDGSLPPHPGVIRKFQAVLADKGVRSHVRLSSGRDIDAACGQLRAEIKGSA